VACTILYDDKPELLSHLWVYHLRVRKVIQLENQQGGKKEDYSMARIMMTLNPDSSRSFARA
jgi:hypothetical protein